MWNLFHSSTSISSPSSQLNNLSVPRGRRHTRSIPSFLSRIQNCISQHLSLKCGLENFLLQLINPVSSFHNLNCMHQSVLVLSVHSSFACKIIWRDFGFLFGSWRAFDLKLSFKLYFQNINLNIYFIMIWV